MKNKFLSFFFSEKVHFRHYFGGLSLLLVILQLLTGIFIILFYDPTLDNAYKSVQHLTNEVAGGSLLRNIHRWVAVFLFLTVLIHAIRCTLRWDFFNPAKKSLWLTGILLLLPMFLLLITGLILPWEWKGYWFMEIVPNYFEFVPKIGSSLKAFFIDSFTLPRYQVIHILILPIITLILVDYHFLKRMRQRGVFTYIFRHALLSLPFIIAVIVLSKYVTIPSNDPQEIPMPLEGRYVPAPEWYILVLLIPLMHYKGKAVFILSIVLPSLLFIVLSILPYLYRGSRVPEGLSFLKKSRFRRLIKAVMVFIIFSAITALIYRGSYDSPTLGCNGCHHLKSGFRMGVPPKEFKDRNALPNLDDNQWMMGHWFYPDEVY
jgi:quinol-cytochrome oxidoreductase complex cytochrome b subunit